jgi:hypothetical protein
LQTKNHPKPVIGGIPKSGGRGVMSVVEPLVVSVVEALVVSVIEALVVSGVEP